MGAIRAHLAEMTVAVESARRLVQSAARSLDAGVPSALAVSLAKLHACDAAVVAADRAVQVHGGYGCVAEFPAERFYRDAEIPRSLFTTDDGAICSPSA